MHNSRCHRYWWNNAGRNVGDSAQSLDTNVRMSLQSTHGFTCPKPNNLRWTRIGNTCISTPCAGRRRWPGEEVSQCSCCTSICGMQPATCQGGRHIIERNYGRTGQHGGAQVTRPEATDPGAAAKTQLGGLRTCNRQTRSRSQTAGPKRERKTFMRQY